MLKIFSILGILGGMLRIVCTIFVGTESTDNIELLYVATDFCLIFGLLGIFIIHQESLGPLGLIGFMISLSAFSFIAGPESTIYGVSSYQIGAPLVGFGIVILSIAQIRSKQYKNIGPGILIFSVLLGGVAFAFPNVHEIFVVTGLLFGAGFIMNSVHVYKFS